MGIPTSNDRTDIETRRNEDHDPEAQPEAWFLAMGDERDEGWYLLWFEADGQTYDAEGPYDSREQAETAHQGPRGR